MAVSRPTLKNTFLIEYCCYPDSAMSAAWMAAGGRAIRVCLPDCDVSRLWEVTRIGNLAKAAMDCGLNVRLHAALPCTPWSALTRIRAAISHTYRVRRELQRDQSRRMLKHLVALLGRLRGPKFGASFGWPAHCDGWSKSCPGIQSLIRELPVRCWFDGCAYGLQSRHGVPLKKPWRVQSSCPRCAALLRDRCPGASVHPLHERTSGRQAKRSERYAPLIVKRLIAGFLAPSTRRAIAEHSRDVLENDVPDEPASGHQLLLAVKTLHSNLGHPGPRSLARAIRLSGGSDEAVSAALSYKCPSCARLREPRPVNPARLNDRWRDFGDLVCVDFFNLADFRGNNQMFLNAVDKASGYQLFAPVDNKRPDIILHAFMQLWVVPLGVPYNILSDNGGEFDAEFSEELESMGARIFRSASYVPAQNATCERRGGAWKAHARALMDEHSITFDGPKRIFLLCASINHAVNTMVEDHGYAPAQWVLGKNLRLSYVRTPSCRRVASWPPRRALALTQHSPSAWCCWLPPADQWRPCPPTSASPAHSRRAFEEKLPCPPSPSTRSVARSSTYWSGVSKAKSAWAHRWHGPGIIVGLEQNNLWISHRGAVVKASSRHVRPAQSDELVPWHSIYDKASRGDQHPPPTPETEMPALSTGEQPTYLDMSIDTMAAPAPRPAGD